ncbi:MAG TPA: hypothetical protein VEQ38_15690 [Verrucomicrobiae bacterium]|nr:hypothetical protein [Verrucomicrobiae bacterium]
MSGQTQLHHPGESGIEPHGLAMTGVREASGSIITSPNGSGSQPGKAV